MLAIRVQAGNSFSAGEDLPPRRIRHNSLLPALIPEITKTFL